MTDTYGPSSEMLGELQRVVENKDIEAKFPAHHASVRQALETALAAPGYQPPPTDPRTPTQRQWDELYGVEPRDPKDYAVELPKGYVPAAGMTTADVVQGARDFLSALQVGPELGAMLIRDILSNPEPNAAAVAQQLDGTSIAYADALKDAQFALDRAGRATVAGRQIKVTALPAYSLTQLAVWGRRLRQHAQSRPK